MCVIDEGCLKKKPKKNSLLIFVWVFNITNHSIQDLLLVTYKFICPRSGLWSFPERCLHLDSFQTLQAFSDCSLESKLSDILRLFFYFSVFVGLSGFSILLESSGCADLPLTMTMLSL